MAGSITNFKPCEKRVIIIVFMKLKRKNFLEESNLPVN